MPRNIIGLHSNEGRPDAELAQAIYGRLNEVNVGADSEHYAEIRQFPNLLVEQKTSVSTAVETLPETKPVPPVASAKAAGNVISFAEKRLTHEENDKIEREMLARRAVEAA